MKANVPVCVGVPEISALVEFGLVPKLTPGGSCPETMLQVLTAEEPWAAMDSEYNTFKCAGEGVTGLMTSCRNTEKLNVWLPFALASAACMVTGPLAAEFVGVPDRTPVALSSAKPLGSCPETIDQVTVPDAPVS